MPNSLLVFTSYYLPGFKAGGPIRSISSLVDKLGSHLEISLVTRNHDIGDRVRYSSIKTNKWEFADNYRCLYLSFFSFVPLCFIMKRIRLSDYEYIYFNSFFDLKFSIIPILYLKIFNMFGYYNGIKIILAPRGEFSTAALRNSFFSKYAWIYIFKLFSVNKFITWHATSVDEKIDIVNIFGDDDSIVLLENFPSSKPLDFDKILLSNKSNVLKLVFIGRVSPMKNLSAALNILKSVKSSVIFDIFGPLEDGDYYSKCNQIVDELPSNIIVNFLGEIKHTDVQLTLSNYDLFFSPTLGENYGHSIVESFLVGCPVLISNNTPWRELQLKYAGFDFSLDNLEDFSLTIDFFGEMNIVDYNKFKIGSYNYGLEISNCVNLQNGYFNLFN
jgi:glycosyltransferase involved in cell wall biosynthesis